MVTGIDRFREHFAAHEGQYAIIGGAACDLLFDAAGLDFRATKDIDVVLCVEVVEVAFARGIEAFLDAGGYQARERGAGTKEFYRFHPTGARIALPEAIRDDLQAFVDQTRADHTLNPRTFGVPFSRDEAVGILRSVYGLT